MFGHEVDFLDTDAVFARDATAEFDAFFEDVVAGLDGFGHLLRIAFIVEDEGMDVPITGMKNVRDAQAVFFAGLPDELHDLRQFRARHSCNAKPRRGNLDLLPPGWCRRR